MNKLNDMWYRLRALFRTRAFERDMDDEVAFHLDMETRKLVDGGLSPEEARRQALKQFGNLPRQREQNREVRGITLLTDLAADIRFALRQLRRNPAFAFAAVVTLALGIGATTAIFSIADQALLDVPRVQAPDRLAVVYTTCRRGAERCSSSYPDYEDYRDESTALRDLAAYSSVPLTIGDDDGARFEAGMLVSGNYFNLLGAPLHLGRAIQPDDDRRGAAANVAVLSYDHWLVAYGADSSVIGQTIRLNEAPYTVVGVTGPGFRGIDLNQRPAMWLPLLSGPQLGESVGAASDPDVIDARGARWIGTLVGRLAPGASVPQLRAEMAALAQRLGEEFPDARGAIDGVRGITVDEVGGYVLPTASATELETFLYLLLGVVVLTLLLASTNIANLLMARASARSREVGMRLAVGADRSRLVRQLLTESLTLATCGGMLGLVVAVLTIRSLSAFELPGGVVIGDLGATLDMRVMGFAAVVTILTALLFGLFPALRTTRDTLSHTLKGGRTTAGADFVHTRKALVGAQVALCLVLLVGAGLFIRTLRNSLASELGFSPHGLVAARVNLGAQNLGTDETISTIDVLLERVRGVPGIDAAGAATLMPFQGGGFRGTMADIPAYEPQPDEEIRFDYLAVTPEYFDALELRRLEGRTFGPLDGPGGAPVAVVNRLAAERYWGRDRAVGQRMTLGGSIDVEIIGVVDDVTWSQVGEDRTPFAFVSVAQFPSMIAGGFVSIVARADGEAAAVLPALRQQLRATIPGVPPTFVLTGSDLLRGVLMTQRMGSVLMLLFGSVALVLAIVGIYGVVGYSVSRRSQEIGIRMAVGANGLDIVRSVFRDMATPIGVGLLTGVAATLLLGSTVAAFLFEVQPRDPATIIVVGAVLALAATIATLIPARRAAREDPVRVLMTD